MSVPLKLGVVGLGWAGRQAVTAALAVPRTQVVAVSDIEAGRRAAAVEEFSLPRGYAGYEEILVDDEVEAVYLAVNPVMRYPMVLAAIAAGKHVLVQKPHAVRADQVLEFEAAALEAGVTLQFCYFMRHFPRNRMVRTAIRKGRIGEPYHARIFLKYNDRPAVEGVTGWLQVYGQKGGALGQHASHELDLAWWWMGCPEPRWAFAVKHVINPAYDGPEGPAEDYLSGTVGFEGGATIQIDCSRWLHTDTPTLHLCLNLHYTGTLRVQWEHIDVWFGFLRIGDNICDCRRRRPAYWSNHCSYLKFDDRRKHPQQRA